MPFDQAALTLEMQRVLPAPPARVFKAWTEAEMLKRWLCPEGFTVPAATADPRVGGRYRIEMRSPEGKMHRVGGVYRELVDPELIILTWMWEPDSEMVSVETEIRIELAEHKEGTLMTMIHSGLPNEAELTGHRRGWTGAFDHLTALLSGGSEP